MSKTTKKTTKRSAAKKTQNKECVIDKSTLTLAIKALEDSKHYILITSDTCSVQGRGGDLATTIAACIAQDENIEELLKKALTLAVIYRLSK